MKTTLDRAVRDEVIQRINTLDDKSTAQWGRMNVYQMLTHCVRYEEMMLHGTNQRHALVGRIFGKRVLKDFIRDESPIKRNLPTLPELRVRESSGDVSAQKERWVALVGEFESFAEPRFVHPFFGKMTREQVGYLDYKHTDHHLRQFGA